MRKEEEALPRKMAASQSPNNFSQVRLHQLPSKESSWSPGKEEGGESGRLKYSPKTHRNISTRLSLESKKTSSKGKQVGRRWIGSQRHTYQ